MWCSSSCRHLNQYENKCLKYNFILEYIRGTNVRYSGFVRCEECFEKYDKGNNKGFKRKIKNGDNN